MPESLGLGAAERALLEREKLGLYRPGPEGTRALLRGLGEPQERYRLVLVGGTNGKGSTALILSALLQAAGLRVGTYFSPYLQGPREAMVVNLAKPSAARFEALFALVWEAGLAGDASAFEMLTAMAYRYFADEGVDAAVVEVGLGGGRDATHVRPPELAVVTNVTRDHAAYLGETLADIAREKAGIAPPGRVLLTAAEDSAVLSALRDECRGRACRLEHWPRDGKGGVDSIGGERLCWRGEEMVLPLAGGHMARNAALAFRAAELLDAAPEADKAREILARLRWPARWEVVQRDPTVVLSGAHNPSGFAHLPGLLKGLARRRLTVVAGFSRDKEAAAMLEGLGAWADRVILTQAGHHRACPIGELAAAARDKGLGFDAFTPAARAVDEALAAAEPEDAVLVTGSLYLAGEVRGRWRPEVLYLA